MRSAPVPLPSPGAMRAAVVGLLALIQVDLAEDPARSPEESAPAAVEAIREIKDYFDARLAFFQTAGIPEEDYCHTVARFARFATWQALQSIKALEKLPAGAPPARRAFVLGQLVGALEELNRILEDLNYPPPGYPPRQDAPPRCLVQIPLADEEEA